METRKSVLKSRTDHVTIVSWVATPYLSTFGGDTFQLSTLNNTHFDRKTQYEL
jgi:hypothetical protein